MTDHGIAHWVVHPVQGPIDFPPNVVGPFWALQAAYECAKRECVGEDFIVTSLRCFSVDAPAHELEPD